MQQDMGEMFSLADRFGLANAPLLVTKPVREAEFSVTHLVRPLQAGLSSVVRLPHANCFFMMLYLEDAYHCDVFADGSEGTVQRFPKGSICLVNLAQGATIRLHDRLEALAFVIPFDLLKEVSGFSKAPEARSLLCLRGQNDSVMWNMGKALLPLFAQEQSQRSCVLGHLAVAICAHLLHRHGDVAAREPGCSAFSAVQEKAAKDFMAAHFQRDLSIGQVAQTVGMSEAAFVEAFERATQKTPRQWLREYRVEQAKLCFSERKYTFEEVAIRSGFRDALHLEEDFMAITGFSLLAWRNRWLN